MSLFGAATTGVDPQTGEYLSKTQRVAMFRASRGFGGGMGGGGNSSTSAKVEPKAAIVVANKFTEITKTLNTNFQQSATNISDQAQTNKQSIENLYNIISNKRTQELQTEKEESRQSALKDEKSKRSSRENLVEGLSAAAAAAVAPLQKTAKKVTDNLGGFWDRLKRALLLLGAAWVIDNLPEILDKIKSFDFSIESFTDAVAGALPNIRGVFTILDKIVRAALRGIRKVASTAFRIARKIATSAFRIARKIFNAIVSVTRKVVGAITNGIKKLVGGLYRSLKAAKNTISRLAGNANDALRAKPGGGKGTGKGAGKGFFGSIVDKLRSGGSKIKSFAKKVGGKLGLDKMQEGASNFMRGFGNLKDKALEKLNPLKSYANKEGIPTGNPGSRLAGIKGLLDKVFRTAGMAGKASQNLLKGAEKIIRPLTRLPGIGIAIDIMLNKAGGQGNEEALVRGLASGLAGMVGAKAGAAVGAGVGTLILPGIGTAAGGILGGLIGSMLFGIGGDALGKAGLEMSGKTTTSDEQMTANYKNIIENITNNNNTATVTAASDDKSTHPEKSIKISPGDRVSSAGSTPEGMQFSGRLSADTFNLEELPPIMRTIPKEQTTEPVKQQQTIPSIDTKDPQSDIYRQMAGRFYELSGAF